MSLADELKKMENITTNDLDLDIQLRLLDFFEENTNCSVDELSLFVNDMITDICSNFTNETTSKDTQTRIQEFNKKIYTIRENAQVQLMTATDEGKDLYGKLFEFLHSEEMSGKDYTPEKDKKKVMNKEQLETRDFEIRKKYLQHIMDAYGDDMPSYLSDNMITIIDQFDIEPKSMENLYFGRMSIDNAAVVKRILFDLGYQVNIDDLMRGTDVTPQKINLITEKSISSKEMPKEDRIKYENPCFTDDEIDRIQDYQQTLTGVEKYFRQVTGMPEIKQYDEMGFEIRDEQESETPITDAMREWGKEECLNRNILESAVEVTTEVTRTEQMNKQTSLIKEQFRDKEKQQDKVGQ